MIRPTEVEVSPAGRPEMPGGVWLHFDTVPLVELTEQTARDLTFALGERLGLFVCPRDAVSEVAGW
ncbi:hypothetical protein R6L23_15365 [Streptomyces sp. SR27]|uniref:hypothetical protein n=1 Tax=Streptomyces sp. SR27 TaxID=3076630 RepID=UPI00295BDD29|nr:hypothetical protein [Streptomyces sp. SR27]MDV9189575.1 hypothetical protein [Streptomyces sp. SR27]